MKFSVLLSVYSGENPIFFDAALTSILHQTLMPEEIVLVKDGPLTPSLEEVLQKHLSSSLGYLFHIVVLPQNQGLGNALNVGLLHCHYDIVARMDSDDIAKSDRFEKQICLFEKYPDLDICSAWIEEFEKDVTHIIAIKKVPETHEKIVSYARHRCPVNHPAVVFRKKAVQDVGGYEGFPEDYLLWIKMLLNGCHFYNLQESVLYFRFSSETVRRRGGWRYALADVRSQIRFYQLGFINCTDLLYNIFVRVSVRLIPTSLRLKIYRKLIRMA